MRRFFFLIAALIAAVCCAKAPDTKADALSSDSAQVSLPEPRDAVPAIRFDGPINDESSQQFTDALAALAQNDPKVLVVEINSPGGSLQAGFHMAKAIENFPAQVVCVVDGEADSEAFYVLQACDTRLMTFRSTIMLHEPYFRIPDAVLTRNELQNLSNTQAAIAEAWTLFSCRRLDMTIGQCQARIRHNDWFMASPEALRVKAIDQIVPSTKTVVKSLYTQLVLMPALMQQLQDGADAGTTGPAVAPAPADAGAP